MILTNIDPLAVLAIRICVSGFRKSCLDAQFHTL